jgi:hypothetical protein
MVEIKTHRDHPASMADRIAKREGNSGNTANAAVVHKQGEGARRTFHNIHHTRNTDYGAGNPGEGDVSGNKRGVVKTGDGR